MRFIWLAVPLLAANSLLAQVDPDEGRPSLPPKISKVDGSDLVEYDFRNTFQTEDFEKALIGGSMTIIVRPGQNNSGSKKLGPYQSEGYLSFEPGVRVRWKTAVKSIESVTMKVSKVDNLEILLGSPAGKMNVFLEAVSRIVRTDKKGKEKTSKQVQFPMSKETTYEIKLRCDKTKLIVETDGKKALSFDLPDVKEPLNALEFTSRNEHAAIHSMTVRGVLSEKKPEQPKEPEKKEGPPDEPKK